MKKILKTIYESNETFSFPYLNANVDEYNDVLVNVVLEHYANIADGYGDFFFKKFRTKK